MDTAEQRIGKGAACAMFGFFDVIQDILSNLRTFGLRDVIDIAVVSLAMYQILLFARKSRAGQLVRGLLLLLVFYALADVMQLRTRGCAEPT